MDRIIVGTTPRTGSSLLQDSLAKHPNARSAGEWYHPYHLNRSGLCPSEDYNLVKLHSYDVCQDNFWEVLNSASHVIYLHRLNTKKQKISWELACRTGKWANECPLDAPCEPPDMDFWIHRASELFEPRCCISVSYESLTADWDGSINRILHAIGWEPMYLPQMRTKMTRPK